MKILLVLGIGGLACGQVLPDGPGKAVTERMCSGCHGLENISRAKRTKEKWNEIVDDMMARGAKGTDEEADQVVEYLAAHFGPSQSAKLNVNKAAAADFTGLGITTTDAQAIVRYRTDKGAFKTLQDLKKVPGIDQDKIDAVRDRLEF